jgi:lipoic acid synthetase
VRPSAGYARSLAVLARAGQAGLLTKSGLMVGLGEREDEVVATMADLRGVGVSIVTVGQYLRPSRDHLPVSRYWTPEEFDRLRQAGTALGVAHVEASPLTRSSYHAREAAVAAGRGA